MSAVIKSLGRSLRSLPLSFWVGYGITLGAFWALWLLWVDRAVWQDRLVAGVLVCAAFCVIAPFGGVVTQAMHALARSIYRRQLAWWHYPLLLAVVAAFALAAYYGYRHGAAGSGDWWVW